MKKYLLLACICLSFQGVAQINVNDFNRGEVSCMYLVSERYNILYLNDTNIVDFRSTGYRPDQLILKGDASVTVIYQENGWPKVIPTESSFELSIYELETDSLIYKETFHAIEKGTIKEIENSAIHPGSHCDHIFSYKNEGTLYRSKDNHLCLRRQHYVDSLITFEIFNGTFVSENPDHLIVRPDAGVLTMITVYYDGKMILSKQYLVGD